MLQAITAGSTNFKFPESVMDSELKCHSSRCCLMLILGLMRGPPKSQLQESSNRQRDTKGYHQSFSLKTKFRASKPLQQDTKFEQQLTTDPKEAFSDVDMVINLDTHQATDPRVALPIVTPAPTDISTSPHVTALRQYPSDSVDGLKQVDEQPEAKDITNCFDFNTTKDTKDEHLLGSVRAQYEMENQTKEADLEYTQEQSIEESMDGKTAQNANYVENTINLDEFPVLTRQNMEEDVHNPNVEAVVHTPTEMEKDDTTGNGEAVVHTPTEMEKDDTLTLMAEDTTKENTTPNNSDVNPVNIGPILHSFEHEGQHYEIRSYMEEGQTSNHNDENLTAHDFQEVQNRRGKKKQVMPRTIKTRGYDPNLEVGIVSEITRYCPVANLLLWRK
ncbi:unnamed protein product [Cuscuta campestris]|uniref:Uncharacterized protein n=1 Tax=Cuscuta campestris TaxID=132261 RepID=A0A484NRY0_9ASTE|nr:unnamed protein product [Cuscuta campestris]